MKRNSFSNTKIPSLNFSGQGQNIKFSKKIILNIILKNTINYLDENKFLFLFEFFYKYFVNNNIKKKNH